MTTTSPDPIDPERANEAEVVLRVRALEQPASDKYTWAKVRVLRVLKNASGHSLPDELEIAYYAWDSGVPDGESTVYLEPYNNTPNHPWKLLGGGSKRGVSHASKQGP